MFDTPYDELFHSLPGLNWLPWIGKHYTETRLLLLCESHYDDGEGWLTQRDATRHFVNNQGLRSHLPDFSNRKLFSQVERTLLSRDSSTMEEREKIWSSVGFCNVVQRLLTSRAQRPSDQDFDEGWSVFLEMAKTLKPTVCIKYGYAGIGRLGYILNNTDTGWTRDLVEEFYIRPYVVNLTYKGHRMRIIFTHHPTGAFGFKYLQWAQHIEKQLPGVKELFAASMESGNPE